MSCPLSPDVLVDAVSEPADAHTQHALVDLGDGLRAAPAPDASTPWATPRTARVVATPVRWDKSATAKVRPLN